jgi:hypothetical protein
MCPTGGFGPSVEATAWFVVAEALTNVVRYAGATLASVRASVADGYLIVEIADDGARRGRPRPWLKAWWPRSRCGLGRRDARRDQRSQSGHDSNLRPYQSGDRTSTPVDRSASSSPMTPRDTRWVHRVKSSVDVRAVSSGLLPSLHPRRGDPERRSRIQRAEAVPAIAPMRQFGAIAPRQRVPVDGGPLGEDVGQDEMTGRGRHEHEAVALFQDVHGKSTRPRRAGMTEQGHGGHAWGSKPLKRDAACRQARARRASALPRGEMEGQNLRQDRAPEAR